MEEWKNVKGYEGKYQVSNKGRVKVLLKWDLKKKQYVNCDQIMQSVDNGKGYLFITLSKEHKRKNHYIHRLVADAFVDNPKELKYVNHIDYNKKNNDASNLEWCTQKENVHHSICNMMHRKSKSHTNTGEMYISKRKNRYRVTIDKKEYRTCSTLKEAIEKRDSILSGEVVL